MKLALLSSGGDAPGMNMAIWALCHEAEKRGWQTLGVEEGLQGLIDAKFRPLLQREVLRWARRGGTELGSSRVSNFPEHIETVLKNLQREAIDGLVILGGNGSSQAAAALSKHVLTAFLPATIDNDVLDSDSSLGFDTALNSAVRLADGIRDSADSIPRMFVLETLGGDTGFLAQAVAQAASADILLVPEHPLAFAELVKLAKAATEKNRYAFIVASEGYPNLTTVIDDLARAMNTRSRMSRIGHAQRGGTPTGFERLLARSLAREAVAGLAKNESGRALWQAGKAVWLPFSEAHHKDFKLEPL